MKCGAALPPFATTPLSLFRLIVPAVGAPADIFKLSAKMSLRPLFLNVTMPLIAKGRSGLMPSGLWDELPGGSGSVHHLMG